MEWASGETEQRAESFTVEYNVHLDDAHTVAQPKRIVHHPTTESLRENRLTPEEIAAGFRPDDFVTPARDEAPSRPRFVSPPTGASTPTSTEGPRRYHLMEEIIEEAPVATLTDSCLLGIEEPTSVEDASKEAAWKTSMQT